MALGVNQNIYVANHLEQDIYVMPVLDKNWLIADVVTDTALLTVGVGEIAAATGAALPAALSTFADLAQFLKVSAGVIGGTVSAGTRSADVVLELVEAFKKESLRVPAQESRNVREQGFLTTYFKPASGWFGMADFKTVDLTILTQDGKQTVEIDSGPDQSWIAMSEGVTRSVYGTVNDPDPQSETIAWN
ncbi:hypothetical protein AB0C81_18500 [Streptomyces roseoverticillatus]|uniref:hypothetical protein n=1 Tax=Streptomyces roseoverticillatus TaxID=66429 RepID=UPI00340C2662